MSNQKKPIRRILALASASALLFSGITGMSNTHSVQAQQLPPEISKLLPQEVNIAGRQIPLTPPLLAAIGAVPALAALIGIIIASANGGSSNPNGSSGSSSRPRVNENEMPPFVETEEGIKINAQARNIDPADAIDAFGKDGVISPDATHTLTKAQIEALDVETGRIYSVPPSPGMPGAGFIAVDSLKESSDGNFAVTTREAFLDEVILETDGPVSLIGKPDFSAYEQESTDSVGVTYSIQPSTDQFTADEESLREELTYKLEPRTIRGVEVSGEGSFRLDPAEFDLDLSWRHGVKYAKLAVNPNVTFEPEFSIPADSDTAPQDETPNKKTDSAKTRKDDRCSESNKDKVAHILMQKSIPVRFTAGAVFVWADITPCIDISADWSLNQKLSWSPKLQVSKTVGAQYSDNQSPRFQIINTAPGLDGSKANLEKAELSFNGKAKASLNPTLSVTAYKLIGVTGRVPLSASATAGVSFTPKQGTVCSVDLSTTPALSASFGPKASGKARNSFGWLSLLHAEEDLWSKEFSKNILECLVYKNQTVKGRILELTNRDVSDSAIGANGEYEESRYYVLQLEKPQEITARSAGKQGSTEQRKVDQILLGSLTHTQYGTTDNRGDWPKYVNKLVAFDFAMDSTWWPSDARMPVGLVSVSDIQNFKLLSDDSCAAEAFSSYADSWRDPSRLSVRYCDGKFAQVGVYGSDWIVQFHRENGNWSRIPEAGHVRDGMYQACYTKDGLRDLGTIDAFISLVPICKREDIGFS